MTAFALFVTNLSVKECWMIENRVFLTNDALGAIIDFISSKQAVGRAFLRVMKLKSELIFEKISKKFVYIFIALLSEATRVLDSLTKLYSLLIGYSNK